MRSAIAFCGVLLMAAPVLAQDTAAGQAAGQDVTKIVKQADEATLKCEQVTYNFRVLPLEGAPGQFEAMQGQAKMIMGDSMETSPFWVEVDDPKTDGLPGSAPMLIMACDGTNAYIVDYNDKTHLWAPMDGDGEMLTTAARQRYMMIEFVHPKPFTDELTGESMKLEGTQKIGDVECDVVYVVYAGGVGESRWYFGKKDHLPHRVDRINSNFAMELTKVNTDVKLKAKGFALKAPEGFTSTEFKAPKAERQQAEIPVGTDAPDWELKGPDGKTTRLKDLRGNVVLIDFWATWCPPCKMAMPGIQELHEHFKDEKVKVFGISTWEQGDKVKDPEKYMKDQGYTYHLLVEGDEVAAAYKVAGIPTFYLIDKDGKIAYSAVGFDPKGEEQLQKEIEKLLGEDGM